MKFWPSRLKLGYKVFFLSVDEVTSTMKNSHTYKCKFFLFTYSMLFSRVSLFFVV